MLEPVSLSIDPPVDTAWREVPSKMADRENQHSKVQCHAENRKPHLLALNTNVPFTQVSMRAIRPSILPTPAPDLQQFIPLTT
jgi:hypothetical protein